MSSIKTRGTNYLLAMKHMASLEAWARQNGFKEQADMIGTCAIVFRQTHRPSLGGSWTYAARVARTHVAMEALLKGPWTAEKAKSYTDLYHELDGRLNSLVKQMKLKKVLDVDTDGSTEYSARKGKAA